MLTALGVRRLALLSNNPDKAAQLEQLGVRVVRHVPTDVHLNAANTRYLTAKAMRGHTLDLGDQGRRPGRRDLERAQQLTERSRD